MSVQLLPVSGAGLAGVEGSLELGLALVVRHETEVNLLGDELECSINLVLAPASHVASDTSSIAEDVVELVVTGGQAGRVHVGVGEDINVSVCVEDGEVVVETASVELRMFKDPDYGVLRVIKLLGPVEPASIPFSDTDFQ